MENYRKRYPVKCPQHSSDLAHHTKKRATDNKYCESTPSAKRPRPEQSRRASYLQESTNRTNDNQEVLWIHTRRSEERYDEPSKDKEESLWIHTRRSEQSRTDLSRSTNTYSTSPTSKAPPPSLSSTMSSSFSYPDNQQTEPFYYTMHPENESVADQKNRTLDKQASNSKNIYSSLGAPKKPSSIYCETSLVTSSAIYDDVFTPNLQRTSSVRSGLSVPGQKGFSGLSQQPSVSTITSGDSYKPLQRVKPERKSSTTSDGYMDMRKSFKRDKKPGVNANSVSSKSSFESQDKSRSLKSDHEKGKQWNAISGGNWSNNNSGGGDTWKRSLKSYHVKSKQSSITSLGSLSKEISVDGDTWKQSLKSSHAKGKQHHAPAPCTSGGTLPKEISIDGDTWKRSLKLNQEMAKQFRSATVPRGFSSAKELKGAKVALVKDIQKIQRSVKSDSDVTVQKCKEGHDVATQRGKLKIAIYHNQTDMLVHIVSVKNIQPKTKKKSVIEVFVFVKVAVVSSRGQVLYSKATRLTRCTKMAQIHELFTFNPSWQGSGSSRIIISVFKRSTRNELVGCMSFGLNTLLGSKKSINGWYYILDEVAGQSKHLPVKQKTDEAQCMDRPNTILPWITLQRVTLKRSADGKYGFTILDTMPVQVGSVEKGSTAATCGLRKGDAFLELGGANVAGIKSRALAEILKKTQCDIQALIQRTGDRSQRPLPAPPLQMHTVSTSRIKHKDAKKKISKAKAKAATVKRMGQSPQSYFHDRPRSLPLIEQRLKRELAAKLAARKARQHLQNSRKRKQKDDILVPKPELPDDLPEFVTAAEKDEEKDTDSLEDIYENSQPEGYYLVPMSHDDDSSEDSSPEAEYATINHGNRLITPGAVLNTPPPPPPPPVQQQLHDIQQMALQHGPEPPGPPPPPDDELMNINDTYDISPKLIDNDIASIDYVVRPKLIKSYSETAEGIYENDAELRMSLSRYATDDMGHFYVNLEDNPNELNLKEDEIPDDIPPVHQQVILHEDEIPDIPEFTEIDRYVEGAATDDSKDRSSSSYQSIRSFGSLYSNAGASVSGTDTGPSVSRTDTGPSVSGTDTGLSLSTYSGTDDSSTSMEDIELPTENVRTENITWAKGVKPFRLDSPGRDLVHVGRLFIKTKKKKLKEMLVILFSDILVFCKPSADGGLKVLYRPLLINDISILDFRRKIAREFSIKLVSGAERHPLSCLCTSLIFRTPTAKLKNVWRKLLQQRLMAVKTGNAPKGVDVGKALSIDDNSSCNMDSNGKVDEEDNNTVTASVQENKMVKESAEITSSQQVPNNDQMETKPESNVVENRTKCKDNTGCVKSTKLSQVAPKSNSLEEKKTEKEKRVSKTGSCEEKTQVPDGEVEYENMDIVRKLRAALNTSNSNHNNRKIMDYSSSSAQSSPALQHSPIERITMSAPSSPAMRAPLKGLQRRLLHRHSSPSRSPTKEGDVETGGKPRRRGLFKRLSGGNRTEVVTAKGSRTLSLEERELQKKKSIEAQQKARRTLSMGDDHLLRTSPVDQPNSIDAVKEEDETAGEVLAENNSVNERQPRKSRNIARDLKDKMRFLRRRHTDSSLRDSEKLNCDKSLVPDSEEQARKWAVSFEHLLRDQRGLEAFRRFLQTEFSDENIEFWLACEEYKTLKSNKLGIRARKIYDDYVTIQAPREVNLDSRTRLETADLVEYPDEHTFDGAQKRIEALMEKDSYPRFLRSEMYHKLLKESKKK